MAHRLDLATHREQHAADIGMPHDGGRGVLGPDHATLHPGRRMGVRHLVCALTNGLALLANC